MGDDDGRKTSVPACSTFERTIAESSVAWCCADLRTTSWTNWSAIGETRRASRRS